MYISFVYTRGALLPRVKITARRYIYIFWPGLPPSPPSQGFIESLGAARIASIDTFFPRGDNRSARIIRDKRGPLSAHKRDSYEVGRMGGTKEAEELEKKASILFSFSFFLLISFRSVPFRSVPFRQLTADGNCHPRFNTARFNWSLSSTDSSIYSILICLCKFSPLSPLRISHEEENFR